MILTVKHLRLYLEHGGLLQNMSFSAAAEECVVIRTEVLQLGTALLRALLGLEDRAEGQVLFEGHDILAPQSRKHLLEMRRDIGLVYRQHGLVSVFNVAENIALPLGYHHAVSKTELRRQVADITEQLQISHLLPLFAQDLSEAEVRLVNLARELIRKPRLLLIDAVMEGLPADARELVANAIDKLRDTLGTAIVMTTRRQHLHRETKAYELRNGTLLETAA